MSAPERAGSILATWAARAEAAEWEERLDDEAICEADDSGHATSCAIVATHRLRTSCPKGTVALLVCRAVAVWVLGDGAAAPCTLCGLTVGDCWIVSEL